MGQHIGRTSRSHFLLHSEHSMEHAMSAFHPELPHGAGLIAISEAYFETFRNDCMKRYMKMAEIMTQQKSNRPSDFIDALVRMQKECNVYQLKLSDWGVKKKNSLSWYKMHATPWVHCLPSTRVR